MAAAAPAREEIIAVSDLTFLNRYVIRVLPKRGNSDPGLFEFYFGDPKKKMKRKHYPTLEEAVAVQHRKFSASDSFVYTMLGLDPEYDLTTCVAIDNLGWMQLPPELQDVLRRWPLVFLVSAASTPVIEAGGAAPASPWTPDYSKGDFIDVGTEMKRNDLGPQFEAISISMWSPYWHPNKHLLVLPDSLLNGQNFRAGCLSADGLGSAGAYYERNLCYSTADFSAALFYAHTDNLRGRPYTSAAVVQLALPDSVRDNHVVLNVGLRSVVGGALAYYNLVSQLPGMDATGKDVVKKFKSYAFITYGVELNPYGGGLGYYDLEDQVKAGNNTGFRFTVEDEVGLMCRKAAAAGQCIRFSVGSFDLLVHEMILEWGALMAMVKSGAADVLPDRFKAWYAGLSDEQRSDIDGALLPKLTKQSAVFLDGAEVNSDTRVLIGSGSLFNWRLPRDNPFHHSEIVAPLMKGIRVVKAVPVYKLLLHRVVGDYLSSVILSSRVEHKLVGVARQAMKDYNEKEQYAGNQPKRGERSIDDEGVKSLLRYLFGLANVNTLTVGDCTGYLKWYFYNLKKEDPHPVDDPSIQELIRSELKGAVDRTFLYRLPDFSREHDVVYAVNGLPLSFELPDTTRMPKIPAEYLRGTGTAKPDAPPVDFGVYKRGDLPERRQDVFLPQELPLGAEAGPPPVFDLPEEAPAASPAAAEDPTDGAVFSDMC